MQQVARSRARERIKRLGLKVEASRDDKAGTS
jgi:hypothetical protein